jgi:inositol-phosphate phosphatase/L-galactose 1-phosphate phosphatase
MLKRMLHAVQSLEAFSHAPAAGWGVQYVGEESSFLKAADHLTDEPTWFIDPLDGTTNFVHGYPFVCVSIGLMLNKEAVVGVVYNPILDELYSARKGAGATLNGNRIHVSSTQSLGEAMIVNNVGASRDRRFLAKTFDRLNFLLSQNIRALRNSGSAAQNMCHVASGVLDAYFEDGYGGPWDVVGGIVIITEAGGVVSGIRGEPFELSMGKGSIICGNRSLVGQVARVLHAADLRRTFYLAAGYGLAAIAAALAVSATVLKYKQLR